MHTLNHFSVYLNETIFESTTKLDRCYFSVINTIFPVPYPSLKKFFLLCSIMQLKLWNDGAFNDFVELDTLKSFSVAIVT